ncbi:MAG: hypothetical protein EBZ77_12280 [Chitinophagia bacterium]|nr:hypothetical protein [Chitinophagia bacterium]
MRVLNYIRYNKRPALQVVLISVLLLLMGACKRAEKVENAFTRITRNWKLVQTATDNNGNNLLDDFEYSALPASVTDYYNFKTDNTGLETVTSENGITSYYPFTWNLAADTLQVTKAGGSATLYYVQSLSNVKMNLVTESRFGLAGYLFSPQ